MTLKKAVWVPIVALVALTVAGCSTLTPGMYKTASTDFKEKGPENSVLVFGGYRFTNFKTNETVIQAIQIDPTKPTQVVNLSRDVKYRVNTGCDLVFGRNLVPGGDFKIVYAHETEWNFSYEYFSSIQGHVYTDIKAPDKPGLYFLGVISDNPDGIVVNKDPEIELLFLKRLRSYGLYFGKDWKALIDSRIKELQNGQK